jgi:hypothetical protein
MKLDPKSFNMDNEKHIELINKIFQMNKPEGVDTLELKIEPSNGRYDYRVSPQYVIDQKDGFDLMKILWKSNDRMNWETKGDRVFNEFENKVIEFVKKYVGLNIYVSGRGVTEKEYWLSQKDSNRFPNF